MTARPAFAPCADPYCAMDCQQCKAAICPDCLAVHGDGPCAVTCPVCGASLFRVTHTHGLRCSGCDYAREAP